jgi:hypothetical protein
MAFLQKPGQMTPSGRPSETSTSCGNHKVNATTAKTGQTRIPYALGKLGGLLGLDKSGSRQAAFKVRALIILAESLKRADRALDLAIVSYCANKPD